MLSNKRLGLMYDATRQSIGLPLRCVVDISRLVKTHVAQ